ncbi:beta-galactosidase isoform X4 [Rhipicephalus sanguineus]|uniref:beta-galactosidase isoform X4 n=1 Tax=Rhipicephalus sanguineus TaxID=34632 RepID=UPI0020C4426C|nr:beta-galactosidase isoform X4 [Rhipicephalus sanguineus]
MARLTVLASLVTSLLACSKCDSSRRSFTVDYANNQFLKDGETFRYISGSLHYFRVPRAYWRDRMVKMRMAGLNALQTYVEWSGHEPEPGTFNFEGAYDLEAFLDTAADVGLLVVLRPGPYICSERDSGGLPYWLRKLDPHVRCRSSGASYMEAVATWMDVLLPRVRPYMYDNGGPVITVQVENEYGNSVLPCDEVYLRGLFNQFKKHLGDDAVLFFTDYPTDKAYKCDLASGPLVTADIDSTVNVSDMFAIVRRNMKQGPLVVTEYYPGWMDNWGRRHANVDQRKFLKTFETILEMNASVNVYMFHGGTNFGFTNGANPLPEPTSYDFEAPLNESGDPTDTYYAVRNITARYLPVPHGPLPVPAPKMNLGLVELGQCCSLDEMLVFLRARDRLKAATSQFPMSFEEVGQDRGYLAYTTTVTFRPRSPAVLSVPGLRDRGYVSTSVTKAVLAKDQKIFTTPIVVTRAQNITILVENTGRNNGGLCETKGIIENVTLDNHLLSGWTMEPLPLDKSDVLTELVEAFATSNAEPQCSAPGAFFGTFVLPEGQKTLDTFLDPTGWGKGVAFVNGFNLGRYWPSIGPQVTLYVPGVLLRPYPEKNTVLLFETESAPEGNRTVSFVDVPNIDGPVPGDTESLGG